MFPNGWRLRDRESGKEKEQLTWQERYFALLKIDSIKNYLKKIKPKYLIHAAALSRPMKLHDKRNQIYEKQESLLGAY